MTEQAHGKQHVCIVSGQLLPNLIPVLMDRPARVHLIVTDDMRDNARRCETILQAHQIPCTRHEHLPSTGLAAIRQKAVDLTLQLDDEIGGEHLVLNATGGTKLMSLAFYEQFRQTDADIIYTDTERRVIESLTDPARPERQMTSVIDVRTYLAATGLTLRHSNCEDPEWQQRAKERKSLSKWLATYAGDIGDFLGALNHRVGEALDDRGEVLLRPEQYFDTSPHGRWKSALERIAEAGLIEWNGGPAIRFADAETARYLGGVWLEEYAWHVVRDERAYEVRTGVECTWDGSGSRAARNEFDLLAVHDNRMLVVECKTSRFGNQPAADSGILYKLESLGSNAGGLFGRMLLLSARELTEAERSRAASQRIDVLEGTELAGLRDYVRRWMGD